MYGVWEPGIPGSEHPPSRSPDRPKTAYTSGTIISYTSLFTNFSSMNRAGCGPFIDQKKDFPHLERLNVVKDRKQMMLIVPSGVRQVSCKSVTGSWAEATPRKLQTAADSYNYPEELVLPGGLQWVQLDLGESYDLWYVRLWHEITDLVVYHDVVVLCSDDPAFKTGVHTLFNNDHDNSSGLGAGADPAYVETEFGRLIPGLGVRARYIRVYSRGSSRDGLNRFAEVLVHGRPTSDTEKHPF